MHVKNVTDLHPEAVLRTVRDGMHPALRTQQALDFVELYRSVFESAPEGSLDPVQDVQDWAKMFLAAEYHDTTQNSLYVLYLRDKAVAGCIVQQGVLKALVSTYKGAGTCVMQYAMGRHLNPAAMLTCVEGLEPFYAKNGWQVLSREENWTAGGPDILKMYRPIAVQRVHGQYVPRSVAHLYPPHLSVGCPLDVLPMHVLDPALALGNRTVECWHMSHGRGVHILSTDGFRLYSDSHLKSAANAYIRDIPLPPTIALQLSVPLLLAEQPRLSDDGQSMVYTRRTKDGKESTVHQKVGRYLRRRCYGLDNEEIKQLCATALAAMQRFHLKFTRDPLVIQDVYENGPSSCMNRRYSIYVDGRRMHPNEIYVHPDNDLTLAYLETQDGDYVARAWTSRDRGLYSDCYGKDDMYSNVRRRLERMLEDAEYEHDPEGLMQGQPLLRVETDCGGIVLGYIDGGGSGVEDDGDTLWVGDGSIEGSYSSGLSQGEQRCCVNCYDSYPADELVHTYDGDVCSSCADSYVDALVYGSDEIAIVHNSAVRVLIGHPSVAHAYCDAWDCGRLECVYEVTEGDSAGDLVHESSALFHDGEVWVYDEAPEEILNAECT